MRADYVLCNNAVIVKDQMNRKYIVTGKGVGFNKRKGDIIDTKKVNSIYIEDSHLYQEKIAN